MISDSNLSPEKALKQNPASTCPDDIMRSLGVLTVEYMSFDEHIHVGQIVVARKVMPDVEAFFKHALELRFPIHAVIPAADPKYKWDDNALMEDNISSGFNHRPIAGSNKLSQHSFGLAFDINPKQDPYIRYFGGQKITRPSKATWNPVQPGTLHWEHPLVKLMEGFGWEWGGHWIPESGRTDYMHFEKRRLSKT